jgi:hypothetical protein
VWRGPLVGRRRVLHLVRFGIDVRVPLRWALDAVGPEETGVEPLRAIGRRHLRREHVARLVVERPRSRLRREIPSPITPISPAPRQTPEDLTRVGLSAGGRVRTLGLAALQPGRNAVLGDRRQTRRHASAAKVLLSENIDGHLRPRLWHHRIL